MPDDSNRTDSNRTGSKRTSAGTETDADGWRLFDLEDLLARKREMSFPYLEFLRVPSLSSGIYRLQKGAKDLQGPHDEDEVYYVISGRARLRVGDAERDVKPGSILYVPATAEHHFLEIEEEMTLLVFFASGGSETG